MNNNNETDTQSDYDTEDECSSTTCVHCGDEASYNEQINKVLCEDCAFAYTQCELCDDWVRVGGDCEVIPHPQFDDEPVFVCLDCEPEITLEYFQDSLDPERPLPCSECGVYIPFNERDAYVNDSGTCYVCHACNFRLRRD